MVKGIRKALCASMALALMASSIAGCGRKEPVVPGSSSTTIKVLLNSENTAETTSGGNFRSVREDYGGKLPEKGKVGNMEYKITNDADRMLKQRGYFVDSLDQPDAPYFIFISSGEKSTGGYDIKVTDIGLQDGELVIICDETSPAPTDMVTEALTYPCCLVTLDHMPSKKRVVNTKGDEFPCLHDIKVGPAEPSNASEDASSGSAGTTATPDPRTRERDYKIPDGWIASLRNGSGEMMRETFVYWDGSGYKYINVTSHTESWGSSKWINKFQSEGTCKSKEDVIEAARAFGSAGFMVLPGDTTKAHDINDFLKIDF